MDGDRFFDRESDLELLTERVREGTHTLLTAQRRMGKTSLVRELLRRLAAEGHFETIFVDLEDATAAADAIAEIGSLSRSAQGAWRQIQLGFANVLHGSLDRIDTLSVSELRVKLRAGIDGGNWRQKGDKVFAALAESERPVVLAIDELPILVNRMLKGHDYGITPEGKQGVDEFMGWLRKNAQLHRDRICLILSGSVSLEPILRQAGLSAHANIYSPLNLKPWDEETALDCLAALAENYDLNLPLNVRRDMCRRLRCQVPHHVQRFFENLQESLRRADRRTATPEDIKRVYKSEMLSVRGQADMDHYENRLKIVLGPDGYLTALDLLTQAAVNSGVLNRDAINEYRKYSRAMLHEDPVRGQQQTVAGPLIEDVLLVLEHDGYLAPQGGDYCFVSGLLEDWWRARHGQHFVPVEQRRLSPDGE